MKTLLVTLMIITSFAVSTIANASTSALDIGDCAISLVSGEVGEIRGFIRTRDRSNGSSIYVLQISDNQYLIHKENELIECPEDELETPVEDFDE